MTDSPPGYITVPVNVAEQMCVAFFDRRAKYREFKKEQFVRKNLVPTVRTIKKYWLWGPVLTITTPAKTREEILNDYTYRDSDNYYIVDRQNIGIV